MHCKSVSQPVSGSRGKGSPGIHPSVQGDRGDEDKQQNCDLFHTCLSV